MNRYWSEGIVQCTGYKESLLALLASKGCDIFCDPLLREPPRAEILEDEFTKEAAYELDDSPGKLCNSKDRFATINRLLEVDSGLRLDPLKCQELRLIISKERRKEGSEDFFHDL